MTLKARLFCRQFSILIRRVVLISGVVSTIPNTSDVKSIGYLLDPNASSEWLVSCNATGFVYRNLAPGNQRTRPPLHVSDLEPRACTFVTFKDGSIIYYNVELGLSIIKPTQTTPVRLCDEFYAVTAVKALAVSGDLSNRVVALTTNTIHLMSLAGSNLHAIEHLEANAFHHCVFGEWLYPTLFITTFEAGPHRGDILVYEFGCECPAEVKAISEFWPLVTDYAGSSLRSRLLRFHRILTADCK